MKRFSPPIRYPYPRFHPHDTPAAKRVLSYFGSSPEGISVYVLTDGTVTQTRPVDESTIAIWYRGGYLYDIDDAAAAVLTAAGYTVTDYTIDDPGHITPPPVAPPDTHPRTWDDLKNAGVTWDQLKAKYLWGSFIDL